MKELKVKIKVRGMRVSRFYKGKWQDKRRPYRFQGFKENPIAIMRDILIRTGEYKRGWDAIMGKLYLYAEGKVEGIIYN